MNISDLISYPPAYGIDMDSDEVEAKLTELGIDPANCTIGEALNALNKMPLASRRAGAPRGNQNNKRPVTRDNVLLIRLTDDEQKAIAAAAGSMPVRRWVREAALEKAIQQPK
ncbi:MAG: hypothetical protein ACKN9T_11245 [Candidatus Methylumidiphilus sp.]